MTIRLKHFKPLITATVFAASSAAYLGPPVRRISQ